MIALRVHIRELFINFSNSACHISEIIEKILSHDKDNKAKNIFDIVNYSFNEVGNFTNE